MLVNWETWLNTSWQFVRSVFLRKLKDGTDSLVPFGALTKKLTKLSVLQTRECISAVVPPVVCSVSFLPGGARLPPGQRMLPGDRGPPKGPGRAAAPSPQPAARAPSQTPCPAVPFPKLRVKPARYCQFEQPLRCVLHGGPSRHFHHLRGRGPAALNWLRRRGCGPGFAAASRPARTHPATCSLHGTR